jgi:copper transport protein
VTCKRIRDAALGPRRRAARVLAVVAIALATGLAIAGPASAHASLISSNPTPNVVLTKAPTAVTLHFDEGVSTVGDSLRVLGPDGSRADAGTVRQTGDGSDITVDLRNATKRGSYFVSWRVVSADAHPLSGAFTFAIGTTSAAPASAATTETEGGSGAGLTVGLSRWAGYLGLVLLLGGIAFLSLCWPAGWMQRRARLLLSVGWAVSLAAALLGLAVKGAYDAGLPLSQAARPDLVAEVLGTTYGKALVARLLLLAGIAIWFGLRARTPDSAPGTRNPLASSRWVSALVALAFLATFTATGHAVAGSGRVLAFTADMAHLAAVAIWVGGLVMLAVVLLPRSEALETARAVPMLSRLATGSVAVLVVTGTYQSWRQVGTLPALAGTDYGRELILKLALVAVAVSFGATSRAWVRRHYRSAPVAVYAASATDLDPQPADPRPEVTPAALRSLRRSVVVEAVVAMLILAVTASLVANVPARTAYRPSVDQQLTFGTDTGRVTAVPAGSHQMELRLYFYGRSGVPIEPEAVTVTLRLPEQDLGPLPVTLQRGGIGYHFGAVEAPLPGDWTLTVQARTSAFDVYNQDVTLPIR